MPLWALWPELNLSTHIRVPLPADISDLGALHQSIVRESVLHEGSCIAVHSGFEFWSDTYYFQLTQPQLVAITLGSDDFDSFLVLLTSNGTEIDRNEDGGTGLDSRIESYLEAGRYTIEATKINADPGSFRLQITGSAPASATQVAAQGACITQELGSVSGTVTRSGRLEAGDCIDEHSGKRFWADRYTFSLTERGRVEISLTSSDVSPYLAVVQPNGRIARDDNDGGVTRLSGSNVAPGLYRIEATKTQSGAGSYRLRIAVNAAEGAATADLHTLVVEASVSGTVTRSGRLEAGDCIDEHSGKRFWADRYTFSLTERGRVEISLTSSDVSPYLAVVQPNGRIARDDNDGGVTRLSGSNVAPGLYRIEATKTQSGAGSYRLRISVPEENSPISLSRSVPEQQWTVGERVSLQLPAATGGSGGYRYSINYVVNETPYTDQAPPGLSRSGLTLSGTPPNRFVQFDGYTIVWKAFDRQDSSKVAEIHIRVRLSPAAGSALPPTVDDPCSVRASGGTPTQQLAKVAWIMFQLPSEADADQCVRSNLNPYKNCHSGLCEVKKNNGYLGGHGGHDVATWNVTALLGDKSNTVRFYSVTNGVVIRAEGPSRTADGSYEYLPDPLPAEHSRCENPNYVATRMNDCPSTTLAVRYEDVDPSGNRRVRTVQYIHARELFVRVDDPVNIGDPLGVMGTRGNSTGVHLHIEVHDGSVTRNSYGASDTQDPIPLLYAYLVAN